MKTPFFCIFILLVILNSCLIDDNRQVVTAGIYDTSFIYHEFSPAIKVNLKLDQLNKRYIGSDSIDINLDGQCDLFIINRIPLESINPYYYTIDNFPAYWITMKNDLEINTKIEYYNVGHQQQREIIWVDTLSYKRRIDNISNWSDPNKGHSLWSVPPTSAWGTYGPWYKLTNAEKYIGIRMKINSHYIFGWIKVKVNSRDDISLISYAIEK